MNERIQRIMKMEAAMDRVYASLHKGRTDETMVEDLNSLQEYYRTSWLEDFEADERGELPKNLKRGILSEDALYDLLGEADEFFAERE